MPRFTMRSDHYVTSPPEPERMTVPEAHEGYHNAVLPPLHDLSLRELLALPSEQYTGRDQGKIIQAMKINIREKSWGNPFVNDPVAAGENETLIDTAFNWIEHESDTLGAIPDPMLMMMISVCFLALSFVLGAFAKKKREENESARTRNHPTHNLNERSWEKQ